MIYCPNKFQRYSVGLRLLYQKFIINKGINLRKINSLRKIYEFEALVNTEIQPVDLENLCGELMTAVIFRKKFDFNIDVDGNYFLNKKKFIALLMNVCVGVDYINIYEFQSKVIISGKFKITKEIKKFTDSLEGIIFKDIKKQNNHLIFNFNKTNEKTKDLEKAYYLLQNPLSVINLYLFD